MICKESQESLFKVKMSLELMKLLTRCFFIDFNTGCQILYSIKEKFDLSFDLFGEFSKGISVISLFIL